MLAMSDVARYCLSMGSYALMAAGRERKQVGGLEILNLDGGVLR